MRRHCDEGCRARTYVWWGIELAPPQIQCPHRTDVLASLTLKRGVQRDELVLARRDQPDADFRVLLERLVQPRRLIVLVSVNGNKSRVRQVISNEFALDAADAAAVATAIVTDILNEYVPALPNNSAVVEIDAWLNHHLYTSTGRRVRAVLSRYCQP